MKSLIERFEEKFIPEPNTGCWIWIASRHPQGYGTFGIGRTVYYAHRISWMIYKGNGKIPPPDIKVCHSCDNAWCVNPDHLWLGSQLENVRDSVAKGRARRGRGERVFGAKLSPDNVIAIRDDKRHPAIIAKEYKCSKENISMILRRKTWRHI